MSTLSCASANYYRSFSPAARMAEPARNLNVWRAAHVLIFLCSIGTSLGALLTYRKMNTSLQTTMDKCMLYTRPWVELNAKTSNCRIVLRRTEWGGVSLCNFVLFAMLASFVYGIISVWFFIMYAPSRDVHDEDSIVHVWKIVLPSCLLSGVLTVLTFFMAWLVTGGVNHFFRELEQRVQSNCTTKAGGPAAWEDDSVTTLYNERLTTQIFVWLILLCWTMATLSLLCRCLTAADFGGGIERVVPNGGEPGEYISGILFSIYRAGSVPALAVADAVARAGSGQDTPPLRREPLTPRSHRPS